MSGRSLAALVVLCAAGAAACDEDCCTVVDSFPIPLTRAPLGGPPGGDGALIANAERRDAPGQTIQMVIATGSPITALAADAASLATRKSGFDLLDPYRAMSMPGSPPVVRAQFRNLSMLHLPLGMVGGGSGAIMPGGVVGGDLLRAYSVEFRIAPQLLNGTQLQPSMTFWANLSADLGFLQDAGYAVIRFTPYGGGETSALGDEDFLGERGPLVLPPTRVTMRTCAVPEDFTPDLPPDPTRDRCCTPADAARLATGVDLSLMIDTGLGPMMLSRSAWAKVSSAILEAGAMPLPEPVPGTVSLATWSLPINVGWSSIPRFVFVDLEVGAMNDPGACVELGRARRTERVSYQIVRNMSQDACAQPCDIDQRGTGLAQSSAAYLEISGQIPVAIIPDEHPFLQALRFDIRPEGPELDGLVGAAALGRARMELDYRSSPARAIFSCEPGVARSECWAGARCPRLPNQGDRHYCFGLPAHTLAPSCAPSGC